MYCCLVNWNDGGERNKKVGKNEDQKEDFGAARRVFGGCSSLFYCADAA